MNRFEVVPQKDTPYVFVNTRRDGSYYVEVCNGIIAQSEITEDYLEISSIIEQIYKIINDTEE